MSVVQNGPQAPDGQSPPDGGLQHTIPGKMDGGSRLREFDLASLPGHRVQLGLEQPLTLDCGGKLGPYWLAWQSYGAMNADKSNVVLICHALTADQFVAETHPVTGKPGWWEEIVGPGKVIDTDRYCAVCVNVLGGCMGSEGPRSINPATGQVWALDFPVITIHDMVRAQKALIDHLGIRKLFLVIGGSMGGMQALSWAVLYPESVNACAALASSARHSAQNIAFGEVGRQAIMADPLWRQGDYLRTDSHPAAGLSVARMAAHITYLSEAALQRKFGRRLQDRSAVSFGFDADFQVESYLRHQGESFVARFDPNSYLYITRAMDYFDLAGDAGKGGLTSIFTGTLVRFFVVSFTSDWLFPTPESRALVQALNGAGADVSFVEIESDKGHDAFLLDEPEFHRQLTGFIRGCAGKRHDALLSKFAPDRPESNELNLLIESVPLGAKILDVGCGDGALLSRLAAERQTRGFGLELDRNLVQNAIAKGLPVIQGDANIDLAAYADDAFDVAILNQTMTELRNPEKILRELYRIARRVIVNVPNLGHWHARLHYGIIGRAPVTRALPHAWYNSPNIRFCTLDDFGDLVQAAGMSIEQVAWLDGNGCSLPQWRAWHPNLFAARGLYILSRQPQPSD